ncbi:ser/Thr protein phosphatase family protein [Annulohypoxylon truncatum]|uniref:ser/Thr protein phosphatase family protein n=1 Tax=Annulohypoxylon truncatum TaxID=327061 RepID=UPI002007D3E7|nr:ser/Thr protein phosphatase family protein [Annulohypoxylon truncatum]KAI1215153.1 ser/Thr protein phosphatase family protein [Annulohypoxylon truncatum]
MDPVKTRFLIISDTHGKDVPLARTIREIDVVIHCGDLTEESRLDEYKASLKLLTAIKAPLKIVIPGNHDFTLDTLAYIKKIAAKALPVDLPRVKEVYGVFGEAKRMLKAKEAEGIFVLQDEGVYEFPLANHALLTVFASPYTPSSQPLRGVGGGFEYPARQHEFAISRPVDVAITHGPPHGVLDAPDANADPAPSGCPELFDAIARARPKLHCFGRVHEQWGAELVTWREERRGAQEELTRDNAVDGELSAVVKSLADMRISVADLKDEGQGKVRERKRCERRGYVLASLARGGEGGERDGAQTLFVNAAIEGRTSGGRDMPRHLPWVVEIDLPRRIPGERGGGLGRRIGG